MLLLLVAATLAGCVLLWRAGVAKIDWGLQGNPFLADNPDLNQQYKDNVVARGQLMKGVAVVGIATCSSVFFVLPWIWLNGRKRMPRH